MFVICLFVCLFSCEWVSTAGLHIHTSYGHKSLHLCRGEVVVRFVGLFCSRITQDTLKRDQQEQAASRQKNVFSLFSGFKSLQGLRLFSSDSWDKYIHRYTLARRTYKRVNLCADLGMHVRSSVWIRVDVCASICDFTF